MKRDLDLVRKLLLELEAKAPGDSRLCIDFANVGAPDDPTVSEHLRLLIEGGFVDGNIDPEIGSEVPQTYARRLTHSGHELLDSIRSDTTWERTKEVANEKGIGLTIDTAFRLATHLGRLAVDAITGG